MKNPQGRETKKPKKTKAKTEFQNFENLTRKIVQVPKTEIQTKP
jgi:hypothetical protein